MRALLYRLALLVGALALPGQAHGQAIPTATGPGSYVAMGGALSIVQADYGHNDLGGGVLFADVNPHWRVGLEGEARLLRWHSEQQVTESNYLGGLRVMLLPRPGRLQPYAKFLAGAGRITLPYGYAHGTFLVYAPGAGLTADLNDRFSLRVVDLEYQLWPQFPYGSLHPYGVSTGISFRLNNTARFPRAHQRSF